MYNLYINQSNQSFLKLKELNDVLPLFDFSYNWDETNLTKAELEEMFLDRYAERQTNGATPVEFKRLFKSVWRSGIMYYGGAIQKFLASFSDILEGNLTETIGHDNTQTIDNATSEPAVTISGGEPTTNLPRVQQNQKMITDEDTTRTIVGSNDGAITKIRELVETENIFDVFFEYVANRCLYRGVI